MPGFVFSKGNVGVISKSGTLTYEAADQVVKEGYGISTAIGIGGDPIIGTTTKDAIELFMNDTETDCIVMIGEIGGQLETEAAKWIKSNGNKKPVVGFIAGETAPKGRTMGHAGAIVGGSEDTAQAKKNIMRECGIHVVDSPADIGKKVAEILK
jgi:succinyl-CoA synthetase alpha subunit